MALIDLGVVKGDTGATGETGIKGDTGSKGTGIASIESIAGGLRFCLTNGENWDVEILEYDNIVVSAEYPILSYANNDVTDLYAQLMNGTCPASISGVTITFKQGTTVLGTATTDNTGKATLTDGYTSTGAGDVSLTATEGSITSETYTIEDCIYYNTNEVSRTTTQGSTIYDNDMSITLPSKCEISFDFWSDNSNTTGEHRYFLLPKSQFSTGTSQPQYGLYVDQKGGNKGVMGKRENNSTVAPYADFTVTGSTWHTTKWVKDNTSVDFYMDTTLKGNQTLSWLDTYTDWCFSMLRWSSTGTSKMKNVKIKPIS